MMFDLDQREIGVLAALIIVVLLVLAGWQERRR